MKLFLFLHQGLCLEQQWLPGTRREGEWDLGIAGQGGEGTWLSRRRDTEMEEWNLDQRHWSGSGSVPPGKSRGTRQVQGQARKPSQGWKLSGCAVTHHTLINTKPLKHVIHYFRTILVYILFVISEENKFITKFTLILQKKKRRSQHHTLRVEELIVLPECIRQEPQSSWFICITDTLKRKEKSQTPWECGVRKLPGL